MTRDSGETIPSSYEGIYAACRSVVTVSNKGEGLYGTLTMELEQSVGRLAIDLTTSAEEGMNWIVEFVKVCQWFELNVVRLRCVFGVRRFKLIHVRQSLIQSLMTYLDQIYVMNDRSATRIRYIGRILMYHCLSSIVFRTLAFSLFTERIFENPRIAERLRAGILEWVGWERKCRYAAHSISCTA